MIPRPLDQSLPQRPSGSRQAPTRPPGTEHSTGCRFAGPQVAFLEGQLLVLCGCSCLRGQSLSFSPCLPVSCVVDPSLRA